MKVYSTKITSDDVRKAFRLARLENAADIWPDDVRDFRPRLAGYSHGVQFYAYSHDGTRPTAHRTIGSYPLDDEARAASWDDYGWMIAHLFKIDPDAIIGQYKGRADFIRQVRQYAPYRRPRSTAPFLALVS
jgi:hypothetical protein